MNFVLESVVCICEKMMNWRFWRNKSLFKDTPVEDTYQILLISKHKAKFHNHPKQVIYSYWHSSKIMRQDQQRQFMTNEGKFQCLHKKSNIKNIFFIWKPNRAAAMCGNARLSERQRPKYPLACLKSFSSNFTINNRIRLDHDTK